MADFSRRDFIWGTGAAAACAGCVSSAASGRRVAGLPAGGLVGSYALGPDLDLRLDVTDLAEEVRFCVIGDTHLGLHDARDAAHASEYERMSHVPSKPETFEDTLAKAKEKRPDLVLLVGDIISYPTLANVAFLKSRLEASGLDWYYVAGNHDWHFEGVAGSDASQRAEWIAERLMPLYRGFDPLMSSRVVKGVRFVAIDNSIYHITPAQLDFYRAEAAKGDPVVLLMHIPLFVPGWGIFTCGNPDWGEATDLYWQIERRERWAVRQSPETFAFREAVLSTPNLVGVFTGHDHRLLVARERGQFMLSVPANFRGSSVAVTLTPTPHADS